MGRAKGGSSKAGPDPPRAEEGPVLRRRIRLALGFSKVCPPDMISSPGLPDSGQPSAISLVEGSDGPGLRREDHHLHVRWQVGRGYHQPGLGLNVA